MRERGGGQARHERKNAVWRRLRWRRGGKRGRDEVGWLGWLASVTRVNVVTSTLARVPLLADQAAAPAWR
jgi:hypothetical protein